METLWRPRCLSRRVCRRLLRSQQIDLRTFVANLNPSVTGWAKVFATKSTTWTQKYSAGVCFGGNWRIGEMQSAPFGYVNNSHMICWLAKHGQLVASNPFHTQQHQNP